MTTSEIEQNENTHGVTGEHTARGKPHGATALTPFLAIEGAREAVEFYRDVFGARVVDVTEIGGAVAHAVLYLGDGQLQLGEPNPAYGLLPPARGRAGTARATPSACTSKTPTTSSRGRRRPGQWSGSRLTNFVSGDRFASVRDPFGVRWSVMSRVEDLSEEESARRVAEWAAAQG